MAQSKNWNPAAGAVSILNAPIREMYGNARTR